MKYLSILARMLIAFGFVNAQSKIYSKGGTSITFNELATIKTI